MADCLHSFCVACINTWMNPSCQDDPKNSTCPVCRSNITTLKKSHWLDNKSSSNSSFQNSSFQDSSFQGSSSEKSEIIDPRGHVLAKFSLKLARIPKEVFTPRVERQREMQLQSLENERESKLVQLEEELRVYIAENKRKRETLHATYETEVAKTYSLFEKKLNEESIEQKAIDQQNEYIDFLAITSRALSTQSPQVLDLHYENHMNVIMPLSFSFMGLSKNIKSVSVLMPETPILYVPDNNELLVGDGRCIWYHTDPNNNIPWSDNVVLIEERIYLTWSTHIHVYDLNLALERTIINPEAQKESAELQKVSIFSSPRDFVTISDTLEIVYVTRLPPYVYMMGKMTVVVTELAENVYAHNDDMILVYPSHIEYHSMDEPVETHKETCLVSTAGKPTMIIDTTYPRYILGPRMKDSTICFILSSCNSKGMRTITYKEINDEKVE